jgi:hypothetical protein
MKDIREKVVILMEIPSETDNNHLMDIVHIQPKGPHCMTYTTAETSELPKKDIVRNDDGFSTDVTGFIQILSLGNTNMDMFPYIGRLGSQITPMMAWDDGDALTNYEKVFNENNSAFVPIVNMLKKVTEQIQIEYPQAFGDKF